MIKIKKLTMENFGLFKKKRSFEFSTDDQKNSTMIIGKNDGGKTTIVYAIRYALFGERGVKTHPRTSARILSDWPNYQVAAQGDGEMYVELTIEHEGKDYRIQRKQKFFQTNTGDRIAADGDEELNIFDEQGPSSAAGKSRKNKEDWINGHLLPVDASQFLFADFEGREGFIDPDCNRFPVGRKSLVNEDVVNEMNLILEKLHHQRFHDFKFHLIDGKLEFGESRGWAAGEKMLLSLIFILGARNIHAPDSFFVFEGLGRLNPVQCEEVLHVILDNVSQSIFLTPINDPNVSEFFTQSLFLD